MLCAINRLTHARQAFVSLKDVIANSHFCLDRWMVDLAIPSSSFNDHSKWITTASKAREANECSGTTQREEDTLEDTLVQSRLLETAIQYVPSSGFSKETVAQAARDLGLSIAILGSFPRGAEAALVEHFNSKCNETLRTKLASERNKWKFASLRERLAIGIQKRLEMLVPVIDAWPNALAIQARPSELPVTLQNYEEIADIIWHATGDRAVDFRWYTRRGVLMGIYGATELYMLTDCSPKFENTWSALRRRMDDVRRLGFDLDGSDLVEAERSRTSMSQPDETGAQEKRESPEHT